MDVHVQGNWLPILDDDQTLEAMIADLGIVPLMVSAVHMTGSLDCLRRWPKPGPLKFTADASGSFASEDAARIRADALQIVKAYRDAGSPPPYRPTAEELLEMTGILSGASDLGADYLEMIVEELDAASDPRQPGWSKPVDAAARAAHRVIVIGAGMSGILAGIRLKQAGIPFHIYEKNAGSGGTWHENRYPGCRVDIPSIAYSYSFMQDHDWPSLYSVQSDLEAYFEHCIERFGLREHITYGVEGIRADYDEAARRWSLLLRDANGVETTEQARSLISAVGFLNRPFVPRIDDAEQFAGRAFHTARWPEGIDPDGKKIAVIGNAATGMQLIPELAKVASKLTIFQRSPQYLSVHPEYHRPILDGERWAFAHIPYFAGWMRTLASNWPNDREPQHMIVDPDWPQDGLTVSAANAFVRERYLAGIRDALAGYPELIERVTPRYPAFVKRPCVTSGGFYEALKRDNVELVTDGIARFVPEGCVDTGGVLHEADIVVYATGFDVQKFVSPIQFFGRGGIEIHDLWGGRPGGYLGIVVPQFPNFYMMYGPGTNLGYNGNQIFNAECQVKFVVNSIIHAIENGVEALEIRKQLHDDYRTLTNERLGKFVWSTGLGTTYFRNSQGEVTTNSPWSLHNYWSWTRAPIADHYIEYGRDAFAEGGTTPAASTP